MRYAPIGIVALALAACSPADRAVGPTAAIRGPTYDAVPSVQTFQIGMRLLVSACAVPTGVVQIPLEGTVRWVIRSVAVGDRLSFGVHTNLQGITGTLPDGSSVVAVGASSNVYNAFDVSDPSAPYTSTSRNKLYLVQPGSGIVYGAEYASKVTVTPGGLVTVSMERVDSGLPACV